MNNCSLWVVLSSKNADSRKQQPVHSALCSRSHGSALPGTAILLRPTAWVTYGSYCPFCHTGYYKRSRFNKITVSALSKAFFSETGFSVFTGSPWWWRPMPVGGSALCPWGAFSARTLTVVRPLGSPSTVSAASAQRSTQAKGTWQFTAIKKMAFTSPIFWKDLGDPFRSMDYETLVLL